MDKVTEQIRIDQLEKYYRPIEVCDTWSRRIFWVCALLSVAVLYSAKIPINWLQQIPGVLFVVAVITYFVLSHYSSLYLTPTAEEARRKQLLSDAFGVPLTSEQTRGYYNNELPPSIARLGASVLENTFFAKNVCAEMAKNERIKILVYFLLWVAAIAFRKTDLGFILIITQTLFSTEILVRWIKIEVLHSRNNAIYKDLYSKFLHRVSSTQNAGVADILQSFAAYEAAKSEAALKQSSKIFHKLNPELSKKWEEIRKKLKIDYCY